MKYKINSDWRFLRTAGTPEMAAPGYDDHQWRKLDLPHDWAIEGDFSPEHFIDAVRIEDHLEFRADSFLPRGQGVYRKKLPIPVCFPNQRVMVEFEGVFGESTLFVNGSRVGENHSGYTGCIYDISDFVVANKETVLTLFVSADRMQGWWYEGAGIYRNVHLIIKPALHLVPWGIAVSTPRIEPDEAAVQLEIELQNTSREIREGRLMVKLTAPGGAVAAEWRKDLEIPRGKVEKTLTLPVSRPHLWDLGDPALYGAEVSLASAGGEEQETVSFGIRSYRFTPDRGFFLNGRHIQLRGGNIHHDFGGLGTALPDRAHEKNVEVLKEMGCNIIRSAHNPAAPALMDACDRLGMLLWAESRNLHTKQGAEADLTALIRRDRNHPSIIVWGLANVSGSKDGSRLMTAELQTLHNLAKKLDPGRATAIGLEGNADANANGFAMVTDLVGYNGGGMGIDDRDHRLYPGRSIIISEYASGRGARGIYQEARTGGGPLEQLGDGRVLARDGHYGTEMQLLDAHIREWEHVMLRPHLAGGVMWSAIEYRGETCGYPIVTSQFGALDICRFPKDVYYYYRKLWTGKPMIHLFPPWNHQVPEGTPVLINCLTNCDTVEIFLNGKFFDGYPLFLQTGSSVPFFTWQLPYEPGEVLAVGKIGGKEVFREALRTPGPAAAVRLTADRTVLKSDGEDLAFIRADIVDAQGNFVPDAAEKLRFTVEGAGKFLGCSSGNPASHEKEKSPELRTFSGAALLIVQSLSDPGKIRIAAAGEGLETGFLELETRTLKQGC